MKSILTFLLAGLISFSASAQAPNTNQNDSVFPSVSAQEYERRVGEVVYSLDHLQDVLDSLHDAENATSQITERIFGEIRNRFEAGNGLLAAILLDNSIPDDKKYEYVKKLGVTLGNVIVGTYNGDMTKSELEIAKRMSGKKWTENAPLYAKLAVLQTFKNVRDIFVPGGGKVAGRYWVPAENARRDTLASQLAFNMEKFAGEILAKATSAESRDTLTGYWTKRVVEESLDTQRYKRRVETGAALAAVGLAGLSLMTPFVDLWSFLGARGDNTLFMSSVIYFSGWITFAAIQSLTIMDKSTAALERLLVILKDPSKYLPRERALTLYERVMRFVPNWSLGRRGRGGSGSGGGLRCGGAVTA